MSHPLPDLAPWRARGIDALITGSVNRAANGRADVRYRLWDVVAGEDLGGVSVPVTTESPRLAAHQVADSIFEKLTGIRGVFFDTHCLRHANRSETSIVGRRCRR